MGLVLPTSPVQRGTSFQVTRCQTLYPRKIRNKKVLLPPLLGPVLLALSQGRGKAQSDMVLGCSELE